MPWWSIIYLRLFLMVIAVGTCLEIRERSEKPVVLILDALSAIICAYLFVSYWISSWRQPLGAVAPLLFSLVAGWQIFDTGRGLKHFLADPEFSAREKRWLLALGVTFFAPAFVVAGAAAINHRISVY